MNDEKTRDRGTNPPDGLNLLVTGMFRSGTTLIARMLNSHPAMAVASDPYRPIFKSFRNSIARELRGESYDGDSPLDDYYFDVDKQELFSAVQAADFERNLPSETLRKIRGESRSMCEAFSEKLVPYVEELSGKSYREVLEVGLELVQRAYGNGSPTVTGFKEVWTGEFAPHFLDALPNSRVIHVVRDPRAVTASNFKSGSAYPIYFLGRQWRKLATQAIRDSVRYEEDVLLVQYERLIRQPRPVIETMCEFLGVEFSSNLTDPGTYEDGAGNPWKQNSHHYEGKRTFNTDSIDKWRDSLSPPQVSYLELYCHFEMKWFDYGLEGNPSEWPEHVWSPPEVNEEDLADWIIPYVTLQEDRLIREVALEQARTQLLRDRSSLSGDQASKLLLYPEVTDIDEPGGDLPS